MPTQFACLHGHRLESGADSNGRQKLLCPLCGAISSPNPEGRAAKLGTLGLTVVAASVADLPPPQAGSTQRGESQATPSPAGQIQTADYDSQESFNSHPAASHLPEASPPGPIHASAPELPGYEIMQELGRGGMGLVYHAYDEKHGRDLALKTLQRMSPEDLVRFKNEFRALADIAHPNLASLYELLSDGTTWCFTMQLINGVEFNDFVWSEFDSLQTDAERPVVAEPPDNGPRFTRRRLNRLYDALRQLALGLNELHRAGKLHSDVKPSNVMMSAEGRLLLLDFGLIAEISKDEHGRVPNVIQGTPHYMAPEQAACSRLTAASDWYAVGVMLYELLTGRLPFIDEPARVMLRKQYEVPVEPRLRRPDVPEDLNDLCMALLAIDPQRRPGAVEVLRAIDAEEEARQILESMPHQSGRAVELVGRDPHLLVLSDALREVERGEARSVFVHGHSGMGKSALIRAFLDRLLAGESAVVLEGRCYEQESVPFKGLDNLVDSLAVHLAELHPHEVRRLMPTDCLALYRLFPVLQQVREPSDQLPPSIDNADQQELRQRALDALRVLLTRMSEHKPVVLFIDDLQWGDDDSADLLVDLVRPPDCPRILLVGSYRREDAETSDCLVALLEAYGRGQPRPHRIELAVDPLTHSHAVDLAYQLLDQYGSERRQIADRIAQESGGSPFFVWELAQHLQEDTNADLGNLELDEVIWNRVRRLPEATRTLLEVFATAGRPMRASEAYMAIDEVKQGPGLLAQLRTNNFIRTHEQTDDTSVETYHDRIRESVVNHLAAGRVRGHHLRIASVIEQNSSFRPSDIAEHLGKTADFAEPLARLELDKEQWQRIFDLAHFFHAAGKPERALPYAIVAAEQSAAQNAFDMAELFYEIARHGAEEAGQALLFRVTEGIGDVLMVRGKYDRADQQFQIARAIPKDDDTRARIDAKRGYLCFKKGDMGNSARHFERALTALGLPAPTNRISQALAMMQEAGVQVLHTYLPRWFTGRRSDDHPAAARDLFRARVHEGLGYPCWFTSGPVRTLWTHLRHMNLAERYGPSQELGRAYAMHAVMITAIPLAARGAAYAERAYQIHRDLGDRLGQGKARSFQTFSYLSLGRFQEGVTSGREAVQLLEQAGDVWEANMARIILSQPLHYLGELQASHREAKRAFEIGRETGDHAAMAIALYFWIISAPHALPEGALQTELERPREDPLSSAGAIQGRGLELLLREDRPEDAAVLIQESLDTARSRGLRNPAIFCGVSWLATTRRILAEREPEGPARRVALRAAGRAAHAALKTTRKYRTCRARALRERGLVDVLEGRRAGARRYFDASLQIAQQQNARYEYAQSLLARGEAGLQFDWPDAEQDIQQAQAEIDRIEAFRDDADL